MLVDAFTCYLQQQQKSVKIEKSGGLCVCVGGGGGGTKKKKENKKP